MPRSAPATALTDGPVGWEFHMALIESLPVVPYIDSPDDRRTLYIAPQVKDVLGIAAEDYVASTVDPWFDNLHPDDREATIAELEGVLEAGGGKQEYRFTRPDTGETVWIEDRLTVIEVAGRKLSLGVLLDVTRQKLDEARIADQLRTLAQIDAVSQRFSELVVSGADLPAIVQTLSEVLESTVVLTDASGLEVVHQAGAGSPGHAKHDKHDKQDETAHRLEQDVVVRGERWGSLQVWFHQAPGRADLVAVERATTAVVLALLVEREASLVIESGRAALVNDVVLERITSGRDLRRRARALGVDFARDRLCVVVMAPLPSARGGARARERLRDSTVSQLSVAIQQMGCRGLVAPEGRRVVALVAVPPSVDARAASEGLAQPTSRCGVGSVVEGDDVQRGYRQALYALQHAALRLPDGGAGSVVSFDDLGLTLLLGQLATGPELARFVETEIGQLVEHDRSHGSHLVATLQAFLAENGSKSAAARRLGVERRTIYYRLERIAVLLGRDLDYPETRLRLDVALRGWDVLESPRL
ncbi:MAG: helix-turn-helix domain-containing protein [Actinomycetia bacterium]|nr:helix-turn-helix domain-containing protein [Actinomycetes bacterium]